MATSKQQASGQGFKPTKKTLEAMQQHIANIMIEHKRTSDEMHSKMTSIDEAYARYTVSVSKADGSGVDRVAANLACGIQNDVIAPIVVSQVDSMVGYLADVFLSGYPLFPVVSTPKNRLKAEMLETLIDDHSNLGGYGRQLLLFLRAAVKYNAGAVEAAWEPIDQFNVEADFTNTTNGTKINRVNKSLTKLKALDMYNTVWDRTLPLGDVSAEGDYAGYVEMISRTRLKRLLKKLENQGKCLNKEDALNMGQNVIATTADYKMHPQINNYITPSVPSSNVDWFYYMTGKNEERTIGNGSYEMTTMYVRLIPVDFELEVPQPATSQIWKIRVINGKVIVSAERIISAYDHLPILFGQPLEDMMGYQTKSVAEGAIPFQEGATTLFNIRFATARRMVSDRALYNPEMINPTDINAAVPAPKIPVRMSSLTQDGMEKAYKQIPFNGQGLETVIQDAGVLMDFSKQLSGQSNPRQGQFQKGNKSVAEFQGTMDAGEDRLRLPAMTLEYQVFMPLKEIMKLNIFQYGQDSIVVSQKTGEEFNIKMSELREEVLSFRISDGHTPKSKMASTEMLTNGMQMLANSPVLQQQFGAMLPGMFLHLMSLGGVRGLEEYDPTKVAPVAPTGALGDATLQGGPASIPPAAPTVPLPGAIPEGGLV